MSWAERGVTILGCSVLSIAKYVVSLNHPSFHNSETVYHTLYPSVYDRKAVYQTLYLSVHNSETLYHSLYHSVHNSETLYPTTFVVRGMCVLMYTDCLRPKLSASVIG